MHLKQLQLRGFKSFAKKTTLDFPHKVSAIVGPNGSGKSNITEAISWVLGEQSIKNLRGKKGEDLIFNGSVSLPTMSKASVSLCFFDGQKENECVTVSRAVYKDGTNEYLLNDSKCRLKDIVEFLSTMNLGSLHHHIIGQGESDKILEASPKERREMIMDSLGLGIYQIRKDEGERKLKKTRENIEQVRVLRQEILPHLNFLKRQVKKAEKTGTLMDKLGDLCVLYFSYVFGCYEKEINGNMLRKEELMGALAETEEKRKEIEKNILKYKEGNNQRKIISDKINNLEREIGRYEGMISRQEMVLKDDDRKKPSLNIHEAEKFLSSLGGQLKKCLLESDTEKIKKILSDIESELAKLLKIKEEKNKKNTPENDFYADKIKSEHQKLLVLLKEAKAENDKLSEHNDEYIRTERELLSIESKKREISNEISSIEFKGRDIEHKKSISRRELEEAEKILGGKITLNAEYDTGGDHEEVRRMIERIKIRIEESGSVGRDIMKEYEEIKTRDDFLENELNDLENTAGLLQNLINQLEAKLDSDFKEGLTKINDEFHKFFNVMFEGGSAELKLQKTKNKSQIDPKLQIQNEDEELSPESTESAEQWQAEEGIEIKVSLPRKKVSSLSMFSGGERALTSIALLFAVSQINPPPFLILDETDAALDESNSRRYAKMLSDLSKKTQLILVTHNRETMSAAGILYGVTMGCDGVSQLLSVKFDEAETYAK